MENKNPESICVFGDSTSWGAWDTEKGGWVNRLWLKLCDHEPYVTLFNLGIDGGTSKTILDRFENESKARNADALIFQTGGNDASTGVDGISKVSIEDFKNNLEQIISKAKAITNKILFIDLKNCDETKTMPVYWGDFFYKNSLLEEYSNAMHEICKKHDVLFLELPNLLDEDFEDGLHPNAVGHQKIFEVVYKFLVENSWI